MLEHFDYVFSENGLVGYKEGQLLAVQSISNHLGEEKLKEFINFALKYIAGELGGLGRVLVVLLIQGNIPKVDCM